MGSISIQRLNDVRVTRRFYGNALWHHGSIYGSSLAPPLYLCYFIQSLHSLRSLEANAYTIPGHTTMLLEMPAPLFLRKPLV